MAGNRFRGWYFKHQKGDDMVAFIPGVSSDGSFVQMISTAGSRQFQVPRVAEKDGLIYAGKCRFSLSGCKIDLPGVSGEIFYSSPTSLRSDIMGPFQFFPMECRHGVLSMNHGLRGSLTIDGTRLDFTEGRGYAEMDSGSSFPKSYQWLQCNDFPEMCSIMVSIAKIPFCGLHFTGCICAIWFRGKEYRLATYHGAKILDMGPERICLTQGKLRLEIKIQPSHGGHLLRAPIRGQMSGTIRESLNANIRFQLENNGRTLCTMQSNHCACEYVPEVRAGSE